MDQILERAEVRQDAEAEEGGGELLGSFKVASFADDDVDFWKNIMASELPGADSNYRKRKRGFDQTGKDFDYEGKTSWHTSTHKLEPEDKRARVEGEQGTRRSQRGGDEDGLSVLDVDAKEVRRIINCIKVFGGLERVNEIVKKAAIKKPPDVCSY